MLFIKPRVASSFRERGRRPRASERAAGVHAVRARQRRRAGRAMGVGSSSAHRRSSPFDCLTYCLSGFEDPYHAATATYVAGALLESGSRVTVRNLQNAPHHNGKEGTIQAWEPVASRYLVSISDGSTLSLKANNVLPNIGVTIIDMHDRGDLNGRVGRVIGVDANEERYHVLVQGQAFALRPANMLLPRGTSARLAGLVAEPQWNGMAGVVVDVDLHAKRYLIELSLDKSLRVKWENVRL